MSRPWSGDKFIPGPGIIIPGSPGASTTFPSKNDGLVLGETNASTTFFHTLQLVST